MQRYDLKFTGLFYDSIDRLRKAIFHFCQWLKSFFCWNREEIHNLLITYIANAVAWVSIYSNYLPAPVRVVCVILTSYYRRRSFVDDAGSRKNEAASPQP
jgi:hypothetical protein